MAAVERSQLLRKEQSFAYRDAMRYGGQGSEAAEKALLVGRMLDESAMLMLEELQTALKKTEGKKDGGAPEEKASVDGVGGAPERRISGRASRPPVDATSWRSDTWADVVQKMNRARVYRDVKRQRTEVKDGELEIIMRTLVVGSAEDVQRLKELDILNDTPDLDAIHLRVLSSGAKRRTIKLREV